MSQVLQKTVVSKMFVWNILLLENRVKMPGHMCTVLLSLVVTNFTYFVVII